MARRGGAMTYFATPYPLFLGALAAANFLSAQASRQSCEDR